MESSRGTSRLPAQLCSRQFARLIVGCDISSKAVAQQKAHQEQPLCYWHSICAIQSNHFFRKGDVCKGIDYTKESRPWFVLAISRCKARALACCLLRVSVSLWDNDLLMLGLNYWLCVSYSRGPGNRLIFHTGDASRSGPTSQVVSVGESGQLGMRNSRFVCNWNWSLLLSLLCSSAVLLCCIHHLFKTELMIK